MSKQNRVNQVLAHLAKAATAAADGVTDALHSAGSVVSEKYDGVKLTIELNRLKDEQQKLFADIGRTMFLIQSDGFGAGDEADGSEAQDHFVDAQQTIDRLLLAADQRQREMDLAAEHLMQLNGSKLCAVCGKVAGSDDVYCAQCGAKLPEQE